MADSPTLIQQEEEYIVESKAHLDWAKSYPAYSNDTAHLAERQRYIDEAYARIAEYRKDEEIIARVNAGETISSDDISYLANRLATTQVRLAAESVMGCDYDCDHCNG